MRSIPKMPLNEKERNRFFRFIIKVFIFCLLCMCFCVGKIIFYEKTDAIVTNVSKPFVTTGGASGSELVTVSYSNNGRQYSSTIIYAVSKHCKGETVKIYCNPENPDSITTLEKVFEFPVIVLIFGVILFAVYTFGLEKI
ncbi:MAG: hypothetical protein Q4F95_09430 [Oscillospiraceae bacterium]|nr:hypothetical protein [Oscillospiraceae bacterium]